MAEQDTIEARKADAEARAQAEETRLQEAEQRAAETRKATYAADAKRREEEFDASEQRIEEARKAGEAKRKEAARRAALSPEERVKEDEARAFMSPEERAKDDESKGIVAGVDPFADVNPLAGAPQFTIFNEPHHTAEFVLTEANGQRSRANAYLADPVSVVVGQPLKQTVAPTATTPGTYVPAAVGADCQALALYAGGSNPTNGLRISVIVRDAEVNGNLIVWGAITAPEQAIGLQTLAAAGIIVRY
ncbi:MAG TPA: head decoration protein [Casimicrobiaceae bacterium]|jgi:Bacteriophage lambda head decoration protein D|nr:head decoration protein [Casimicrobiaceae bacterium]